MADLGLARFFVNQDGSGQSVNSVLHTRCGSEEYAAPEIIRGLPYDGRMTDAWSVGVVIYACLFGTLPFAPDDEGRVMLREEVRSDCTTGYAMACSSFLMNPISEDCRRVIYALLRVIPGIG